MAMSAISSTSFAPGYNIKPDSGNYPTARADLTGRRAGYNPRTPGRSLAKPQNCQEDAPRRDSPLPPLARDRRSLRPGGLRLAVYRHGTRPVGLRRRPAHDPGRGRADRLHRPRPGQRADLDQQGPRHRRGRPDLPPRQHGRRRPPPASGRPSIRPLGARSIGIARGQGYGVGVKERLDGANAGVPPVAQAEHIDAAEEHPVDPGCPRHRRRVHRPFRPFGQPGHPGRDLGPRGRRAVRTIREAAAAAGIPAGIFAPDAASGRAAAAAGFTLIAVATDALLLVRAARNLVRDLRSV